MKLFKRQSALGQIPIICLGIIILVFSFTIRKPAQAQATQSVSPMHYVFTGNGNWNTAANWRQNRKPPAWLPPGDTISIQSQPADSCLLETLQHLETGAVLQIAAGARLIVKGGVLAYVPADSFFTDTRDGKKYTTKKYGNQIWMTMNLNYNYPGSFIYDNQATNATIYGRLYDWTMAKSACPAGWHLPSLAEWNTLTTFIGSGGHLKDTLYWQPPNTGASNITAFNARPGGYKSGSYYEELGFEGRWWTSTEGNWEYQTKPSYLFYLLYNSAGHGTTYDWRWMGYAVRCVKN